jgi:hypothetical protein
MNQAATEIISAYFDGELTGEKLAEAERILAASPTARRWLKELRAMGANVQSLPQSRLDVGFADRVLQAAERQMLAAPKAEPGERFANQPAAARNAPASEVAAFIQPATRSLPTRRSWKLSQALLATLAAAGCLAAIFAGLQAMRSPDVAKNNRRPGQGQGQQAEQSTRAPQQKPEQFPYPVAEANPTGTTADALERAVAPEAQPQPGAVRGYHWAFVCDSFSQPDYDDALKRFEAILTEQGIALDTRQTAQSGGTDPQSRLYVVDASAPQLSAVLKHLEGLAAQQRVALRVGRGDPGPSQVAKGTGGAPEQGTTSAANGSRSRAVQLPTGKGPMLTNMPRPGGTSTAIQRAVFVFRVVTPPMETK